MWLLALGAAIGIALAAYSLASPGRRANSGLPDGVVARVNGEIIRTVKYSRLINAVARDRRKTIDGAERRRILDRLIDEELLVQRGLELGLAKHDRKIRSNLTRAVIASVVAESQDLQPTDAELQEFYESNGKFFARAGSLDVRQVFIRSIKVNDPAALKKAELAAARLRGGEDLTLVRAQLGDPELAPLPSGLLPPTKLREYLGPTVLRALRSLEVGTISDPVRSGVGYHVLQLLERQESTIPPLSEIRPQVVTEFQRRHADDALRDYLDGLRARSDVEVAPQLR